MKIIVKVSGQSNYRKKTQRVGGLQRREGGKGGCGVENLVKIVLLDEALDIFCIKAWEGIGREVRV